MTTVLKCLTIDREILLFQRVFFFRLHRSHFVLMESKHVYLFRKLTVPICVCLYSQGF